MCSILRTTDLILCFARRSEVEKSDSIRDDSEVRYGMVDLVLVRMVDNGEVDLETSPSRAFVDESDPTLCLLRKMGCMS